jgi:hypothetical protein
MENLLIKQKVQLSILVNRDMIKAIAPREKTIFLHNGTSLPVSVRKLKELTSPNNSFELFGSNIPEIYKDDYLIS